MLHLSKVYAVKTFSVFIAIHSDLLHVQICELNNHSCSVFGVREPCCGMYIRLSDDKHQMVQDSSKKCTGQRRRNSNPVATLPHAAVVFRMQPFNVIGQFHNSFMA